MAAHTAFCTFPTRDRGVLTVASHTPLTVSGCDVDIRIHGTTAQVTLSYEYTNELDKDQEVIAVYPLPFQWEMRQCSVMYDGQTVCSRIERGTIAVGTEAASALGVSAPRSDQSVWTVAAQPIPWVISVGASLVIKAIYHISYSDAICSGKFYFSMPPEIFPVNHQPHRVSKEYGNLFRITGGRYDKKLSTGLKITMNAELLVSLRGEVAVEDDNDCTGTLKVDYTGDNAFTLQYTRDLGTIVRKALAVSVIVQETAEPLRFFLSRDTGSLVTDLERYSVAICFTPLLKRCPVNSELFFILDSHSHNASVAISGALRFGLKGLPSTVLVNFVILNDDKVDLCLFKNKSKPIEEIDLEQVCGLVAAATPQDKSSNGTHIQRALFGAMGKTGIAIGGPVPAGYARNIIIISDCNGSTHATEIINVASTQLVGTISTVALSFAGGVDAPFLSLLASEGGGTFSEARTPESAPHALVSILSACVVPMMTNTTISINSASDIRFSLPSRGLMKVLPRGSQRLIYGFASSDLEKIEVTVTGKVGDSFLEYTGEVVKDQCLMSCETVTNDPTSAHPLHIAAAASRIHHLVEHNERSSLSTSEEEEITRLSTTFLIASPSTFTFQVFVRPGLPDEPLYHTGQQKVAIRFTPRHWHYEQLLKTSHKIRMAEEAKKPRSANYPEIPPPYFLPPTESTTREFIHKIVLDLLNNTVLSAKNIERLVTLQAPDGSFPLNSILSTCLGVSLSAVSTKIPSSCSSQSVWATVCALSAMRHQKSCLTTLVENKAVEFLNKKTEKEWESWMEEAKAIVCA